MPMPPFPPKNATSVFSSIRGNHVGIRVPDFQASKKWFVEKLDFRVLHEWPFADLHIAYLAPPNDDTFLVELIGDGNPHPQKKYADLPASLRDAGYHHFCLTVESVDKTLAELRRRGVTIVGEPFNVEAVSRRLGHVSDPWGNIIEFTEVIP